MSFHAETFPPSSLGGHVNQSQIQHPQANAQALQQDLSSSSAEGIRVSLPAPTLPACQREDSSVLWNPIPEFVPGSATSFAVRSEEGPPK